MRLGHLILAICLLAVNALPVVAQCTGPNGNRFNLEPRPNAVVQTADSVAVLPNGAGSGRDLVVAAGSDGRGLFSNLNATLISEGAFYVQRSSSNCAADFEGGLPSISNIIDLFIPTEGASVVADPARDAFFIVNLEFGSFTDDNGVGIYRTTATNLLSSSACPNGTEIGTASCWTTGAVTDVTELNAFLSHPNITVDPRATGTGAGDVYAVVSQADPNDTLHKSVFLTACVNSNLNCSNSIKISGGDLEADYAWVQVRPDGGITISYRNTSFPGINPEDIKFVNCTPNGAPKTPTCSAATLVLTEKTPIFAASLGDVPMDDALFPKHVDRLESDGKTVTTFLVYDKCEVAVIPQLGAGSPFCPKTDVVLLSSNNGGITWSPISKVSNGKGHQFFGAIALDSSTSTVNIAYYSTENDFFLQRPQVFLTQIAPGAITAGTPQLLTSASADVEASSPISLLDQPAGFGDRLGLAAAGTGTSGQSHAYTSFTWNSVAGTYNGISSVDVNNHLTSFEY